MSSGGLITAIMSRGRKAHSAVAHNRLITKTHNSHLASLRAAAGYLEEIGDASGGSCMHTLSKLLRQNIMHACMHACICSYKKHRDLQIQPVDGLGAGFASLELGVTSAFFTVMHAVINN